MNGKTLLIALLFVAAAGGGYYVLKMDSGKTTDDPSTPKVEPRTVDEPAEEPKIEVRQATGKITIDPDSVPREKRLMTPDGDWVAALNDAVNVRDFKGAWPNDIPWSPIVAIERDTRGQDWWVHEDGSKSTSLMIWRRDLGRMDSVLQIANPTDVAQPLVEEGDLGPVRPGAGRDG